MIAVDVVLLPDPTLDLVAVTANRDLLAGGEDGIRLGRSSHEGLPHISLAMGALADEDVPALEVALARVAAACPLEGLYATEVRHGESSEGRILSLLQIDPTVALRALHHGVMHSTSRLLSTEVDATMLALEGEPLHAPTLEWISTYGERSAFERFDPHVTLGYGRIELPGLPRRFPAGTLAACQLGNNCTCRRVLFTLS